MFVLQEIILLPLSLLLLNSAVDFNSGSLDASSKKKVGTLKHPKAIQMSIMESTHGSNFRAKLILNKQYFYIEFNWVDFK